MIFRSSKNSFRVVIFAKAFAIAALSVFILTIGKVNSDGQDRQKQLDPKSWGGNHVGKSIPEYVQGDECLFCHRNDIGPTWQDNSHTRTVRDRALDAAWDERIKSQPALSKDGPMIDFIIGSRIHTGFLRKSGYGAFDILNTRAVLGKDAKVESWHSKDNPQWETDRFAKSCAGCHTTAIDPKTLTFNAYALDCYSCHGSVDLDHTKDTSLVLLSKKNRKEAQVITSLCAQCHLRGGKSLSSGLPYPNTFIAGDNLFQDYEVDFSKADDPDLNPGDRHVYRNVRDVVIYGKESTTCVSCHQVHANENTTLRHRRILREPICTECHNPEGSFKYVKPYRIQSEICGY